MILNLFWFTYFMSILTMDISSIYESPIGNIAILLSVIYLLYKAIFKKEGLNISMKFIAFMLFLIIISVITLLINQNLENIYLLRAIKLNSFLLFYLVGYNINNKRDSILKVFLLSYFIFICILLLQNVEIFKSIMVQRRILSMDFLFFKIYSANLFAVTLVFIQWFNFTLINIENNKFIYTIRWLSLIFSMPVIVSIYSRTAFVVGFIIIIYNIFISYRRYKGYKKKSYLMASTLGLIWVLYILKDSSIAQRLLYTFSTGSMGGRLDNSTYSRILIVKNLFQYFTSSIKFFLFGTGFEDYESVVNNMGFYFSSAHNGFLNIWFKTGIVYLISILYFILHPLLRNKLQISEFLNKYKIGILLFVISNITAEAFSYFTFYQIFFLGFGIAIRDDKDNKTTQ